MHGIISEVHGCYKAICMIMKVLIYIRLYYTKQKIIIFIHTLGIHIELQ